MGQEVKYTRIFLPINTSGIIYHFSPQLGRSAYFTAAFNLGPVVAVEVSKKIKLTGDSSERKTATTLKFYLAFKVSKSHLQVKFSF